MSKYADYKEKNRFLFSLIKLIKSRKNSDLLDLILYEKDGIISRNINKDALINQKKVLICYLTNISDTQDLQDILHTSVEEKYIIIQYFAARGYQIDICNCRNNHTIKQLTANKYDVIFGFGPAYQWAYHNWSGAFHIEYYTESPYWYSAQKEQERIDYYNARRGSHKKVYRTGMFYQQNDEYNADAIICMCEPSFFKDTAVHLSKIYPHGLFHKNFVYSKDKDPRSFLFFGTAGYIHKGLDVTVEAFDKLPYLTLYVCGGMEQYIADNGLVPNNVIDYGKINVQSNKFSEVAAKCMFVILPSCSEASPSGVLTCMRHGLIPVISRGLGLDSIKKFCFFLEDYHIDYLTNRIEEIADVNQNSLSMLSEKIYHFANENFSLEHFKKEFFNCMDKILGHQM